MFICCFLVFHVVDVLIRSEKPTWSTYIGIVPILYWNGPYVCYVGTVPILYWNGPYTVLERHLVYLNGPYTVLERSLYYIGMVPFRSPLVPWAPIPILYCPCTVFIVAIFSVFFFRLFDS